MILKNNKYERFAQERAQGLSQVKAAVAAGYSESSARLSGYRIEARPEVKARIEELKTRAETRCVSSLGLDKAWVMERLVLVIETAIKPPMQGNVANRALELIGKELGMFADTIPRNVFDLIMFRMGEVVMKHIEGLPGAQEYLDRICEDWKDVSADPKAIKIEHRRIASEAPSGQPESSDHNIE